MAEVTSKAPWSDHSECKTFEEISRNCSPANLPCLAVDIIKACNLFEAIVNYVFDLS
jgi:hypothetical protein